MWQARRTAVTDLVLVKLVIHQFVLALFLERDDDQGDEDVDKEERENDEVDDVEDSHLDTEARLRSTVLVRSIDRMLKNSVHSVFINAARHYRLQTSSSANSSSVVKGERQETT